MYELSESSLSSSDDDPADIFESRSEETSLSDGSEPEDKCSRSSSESDESVDGARNVERECLFLQATLSKFYSNDNSFTYGLRTGDGESDLGTLKRIVIICDGGRKRSQIGVKDTLDPNVIVGAFLNTFRLSLDLNLTRNSSGQRLDAFQMPLARRYRCIIVERAENCANSHRDDGGPVSHNLAACARRISLTKRGARHCARRPH